MHCVHIKRLINMHAAPPTITYTSLIHSHTLGCPSSTYEVGPGTNIDHYTRSAKQPVTAVYDGVVLCDEPDLKLAIHLLMLDTMANTHLTTGNHTLAQ